MGGNGIIAKGKVYGSSIASGADFLSADVSPSDGRSTFRLSVQLSGAAKIIVTSDDGLSGGKDHTLNNDTDLAAGCLYTFVWGVDAEYTYNLKHDDAGALTVDYCLLDEITQGAI